MAMRCMKTRAGAYDDTPLLGFDGIFAAMM